MSQEQEYQFLDEDGLNKLTETIFQKIQLYYVLKTVHEQKITELTGRIAALEVKVEELSTGTTTEGTTDTGTEEVTPEDTTPEEDTTTEDTTNTEEDPVTDPDPETEGTT